MVSSRADKGKAAIGAKKSRVLPKSSRRAKIPDDFLKTMPSKRTRALIETSATDHRPNEGVAEDVRPLKVRPPRFKEVSLEVGGGLGGDQSLSKGRVGGDSFRGPPPMYSQGRTPTGQAEFGGPFSPDNSVDFMCSYARNFMRSGDSGGAGKISNDDRVRIASGQLWTAIGNWRNQGMRLLQLNEGLQKMESELIIKKDTCSSLERELGEAKNEISSLKARLAHSEALTAEGIKATEYRERLRKSRALVKRLQRELPDQAIDRWVDPNTPRPLMKSLKEEPLIPSTSFREWIRTSTLKS
ncbi:hypothetical protein ACOSQ2_012431 [Xanthoceras sorbifolium]